jgi:hypothetical protein
MRRTLLTTCAAFVLTLSAPATHAGDPSEPVDALIVNDVDAPVPVQNEVIVVKVTTAETTGRVVGFDGAVGGVGALNEMCTTEFGPSYRLCRSEEVVRAPELLTAISTTSTSPQAWVGPVVTSSVVTVGTDGFTTACKMDITGTHSCKTAGFGTNNSMNLATLSCDGWTSEDLNGLALVQGIITVGLCNAERHVACCGPR